VSFWAGWLVATIVYAGLYIWWWFKGKPARKKLAEAIAVNKVNEVINEQLNEKVPVSKRMRLSALNNPADSRK